jgi:hypothetical protein
VWGQAVAVRQVSAFTIREVIGPVEEGRAVSLRRAGSVRQRRASEARESGAGGLNGDLGALLSSYTRCPRRAEE